MAESEGQSEKPVKEDLISVADNQLPRGEFIGLILKRATLAGAVLAAPKILDKFLIPPAWAYGSSCNTSDTVAIGDVQLLIQNSTINPTDSDYLYATSTGTEGTYCVKPIGNGTPIFNF